MCILHCSVQDNRICKDCSESPRMTLLSIFTLIPFLYSAEIHSSDIQHIDVFGYDSYTYFITVFKLISVCMILV